MRKPAKFRVNVETGPDGQPDEAVLALSAWNRAGGGVAPSRIETLKHSSHTSVYRLEGVGPQGRSVCAKRSGFDALAIEKTVYQDILTQVPGPVLACQGLVRDEEDPQLGWLFVEDAGELWYDPDSRDQKKLFTQWLAHLHTTASDLRVGPLPDRGARHYLKDLVEGRKRILENIENPALRADQVLVLREIVSLQNTIESHWRELEVFCESMPKTLIHGDIAPKNVRFRHTDSGLATFVLDWETAGWGEPAADLERLVNLPLYQSIIGGAWPRLQLADIKQLSACGRIFRLLAAVNWDSLRLTSEWVERPMRHMAGYRNDLRTALRRENWID